MYIYLCLILLPSSSKMFHSLLQESKKYLVKICSFVNKSSLTTMTLVALKYFLFSSSILCIGANPWFCTDSTPKITKYSLSQDSQKTPCFVRCALFKIKYFQKILKYFKMWPAHLLQKRVLILIIFLVSKNIHLSPQLLPIANPKIMTNNLLFLRCHTRTPLSPLSRYVVRPTRLFV